MKRPEKPQTPSSGKRKKSNKRKYKVRDWKAYDEALVSIRVRAWGTEPLHFVVDSSGIKVFGEGEWKVRQHGISKRRTWEKLHFGFDEQTGDVVAASVTDNDVHDSGEFPGILDQIPQDVKIMQVSNDGGYDKN